MNKKGLLGMAASAVVCAAGAAMGVAMMIGSGKKLDEKNKRQTESDREKRNTK